jgi:hypothetical protein
VTPTVSLRKKAADQKTATLELANWFRLFSVSKTKLELKT